MIFNPNAKVNKEVAEYFREMDADINCVAFDSVNPSEKGRKEVVTWFREQKDAVLINVNVFTTGFDDPDVECIILNRATKSLSLYLQMVGRGSRITNNLYKPNFTVVDLGGNLLEHGKWSDRRNWLKYFEPKPWRKKDSIDELKMWKCKKCDCFNEPGQLMTAEGTIVCEFCGWEREMAREKSPRTGEFVYIDKPKPPNAKSIIDYTKRIGGNATTAFKILDSEIVDLFYHYEVTPEFFDRKQVAFTSRVIEIYRPIYFAIIRDRELDGKRRKYKTQIDNIVDKMHKIYE
jgi:hypothetical protein